MDHYLYVAMTGAQQALRDQQANSHNLANVSTTGYRADLTAFRSYLVAGQGYDSRVNAVAESSGFDTAGGTIEQTGRKLDVAINGAGWLAVQSRDGTEGYTRAGDLRVNGAGLLTTASGLPVLGDSGPISVPPYSDIAIGRDGTVSVVPLGQQATTQAAVGRIRLVNPPADTLVRGADGLFRLRNGTTAAADAGVTVTSGALESSNVSATEALINMIDIARQYEMQTKLLRTANDNDTRAAQLLSLK